VYTPNPKLVNSGMWACRPQTGRCPNGCSECYYNHPGYYEDITQPSVPDPADVGDDIVRMDDGHDSNLQRELVVQTAAQYKNVFYNTSIARLNFDAPVVLTANPREEQSDTWAWPDAVGYPINLMAVRIRLTPANVSDTTRLLMEWTDRGVAVLVSHMRYYTQDALFDMLVGAPTVSSADYDFHKHVLNDCWQPNAGLQQRLGTAIGLGRRHGAYLCGDKPCKDCRQCESLYWLARRRMELAR
jgi:hypothetical protein